MKVKMFSDICISYVQNQINNFLERNKDIHIIDIKFQITDGNYVEYSVMIIYEEKENKNEVV